MGKELEYKLNVSDETLLLKIMADAEIEALSQGPFHEIPMRTTYYDSADRRFGARRWTFRHRQEGDTSVVCVKTPLKDAHARGEWQVEAEKIGEAAVVKLIEQGAPAELLYLYGEGDVSPVCGAEFLRRHRMLCFSDGSLAELACDSGLLLGRSESLPFCELELELYEGSPEKMIRFTQHLCQKYGLKEQPLSKFSRARRLK